MARRFVACCSALLLVSSRVTAQSEAFLRLERTAQSIVSAIVCSGAASNALARGAFGPRDSAGTALLCLSETPQTRAVSFSIRLPDSLVVRPRLANLRTMTRDTTPFDTTRFVAEMRASRLAANATPPLEADGRERIAITVRTVADTIEVWYITAAQFGDGRSWMPAALGGERGFVVSPDGGHIVREVDHRAAWRAFVPGPGQTVVVESEEAELPLLTEMLAIMQLTASGRASAIQTRDSIFVYMGGAWLTSRRRAP